MKDAHTHIISCLLSEMRRKQVGGSQKVVRVLDAGCGYGALMLDAIEAIREIDAGLRVEIFGFEVQDHGGGRKDYWDEVRATFKDRANDLDWNERIRVVSSDDPWPFGTRRFDFVLSNQVLEHVSNLGWFLEQQLHALAPGGIAIQHFPALESLVDPHSGVPFVHWPDSDRNRALVLRLFSTLGIGKYGSYRKERGHSKKAFVDEFSRYLRRYTYFRPLSQIFETGNRVGFECAFRYNWALFRRWLRDDRDVYPYPEMNSDAICARLLSRVASSTLVCRKRQ